ncbi:unnamed protein product [Discosporangium mesarthrocarpum]
MSTVDQACPLQPPNSSTSRSFLSTLSDGPKYDAYMADMHNIETLRGTRSFPALDSYDTIIQNKRDNYLGPTMESNWVLPGKLLVGAYPASIDDEQHAHLLCAILLEGVSTFVCLQQEYLEVGVTEAMWKTGEAIRPYYDDVLKLLCRLQELRKKDPLVYPSIAAPEKAEFVHFPIVDCNIADDTKVLRLAVQLSCRVASGEVMYLHCWGGHGRTGTVVSIMLHLMYGLGAKESMERCQFVHDVRRVPIQVGSPQTESQRQQVERIVGQLVRSRATASVTPPPAPTQLAPLPPEEEPQRHNLVEGDDVVAFIRDKPGAWVEGATDLGQGQCTGTTSFQNAMGSHSKGVPVLGPDGSLHRADESRRQPGASPHEEDGGVGVEGKEACGRLPSQQEGAPPCELVGPPLLGLAPTPAPTAPAPALPSPVAAQQRRQTPSPSSGGGSGAAGEILARGRPLRLSLRKNSFVHPYNHAETTHEARRTRMRRKSVPTSMCFSEVSAAVAVPAAEDAVAATMGGEPGPEADGNGGFDCKLAVEVGCGYENGRAGCEEETRHERAPLCG